MIKNKQKLGIDKSKREQEAVESKDWRNTAHKRRINSVKIHALYNLEKIAVAEII